MGAHRYQALDAWRGICALIVALHHFRFTSHLFPLGVVRGGFIFVDFFFVLSGFVIAYGYGHRITGPSQTAEFLARRIGRLLPLHVVVMGLILCLVLLKLALGRPLADGLTATTFLSNLFLVHAFTKQTGLYWNQPSWSISAELFAYCCFAVVARTGRPWLPIAISMMGFVLVAAWSPSYIDATVYLGWARALFGFFLGYATYQLTRRIRTFGNTALELISVVLVVAFVSFAHGTPASLFAPLLFAATVLIFSQERGAISAVLLRPPFQALGRWSYSIYLLHYFIILLIIEITAPASFGFHQVGIDVHHPSKALLDFMVVAYVIAVIAGSAMAYRFIEMPGQAAFRRLQLRRRPPDVLCVEPARACASQGSGAPIA